MRIRLTARRAAAAAAVAGLVALLVLGLVGLAGQGQTATTAPLRLSAAQMRARLAGSPPALAALHTQAAEILPGGLPALRARLRALRGEPVVINKWASWCTPCRQESAVLQRVSLARGRQVAFIGIDTSDSRSAATAFLRSYPLSYPSYFDPGGELGEAITDSPNTPVTVFYDRSGRFFIYQGPFTSTHRLEADIERYALDS